MKPEDEQQSTISETPPSPQESVKEAETTNVTPLIPEKTRENNTPGVFVLQWLTYAFWGWTIVGVAYLVSLTAGFILAGEGFEDSIQEPVAYGIAAVLVLLPVALLCDIFYSRLEAEHKKGASSVIMVIHAVLFALFGIGTLIAIAFSLVNMLLSGYGAGPQVVLITSLVMFVLYVLTLIRTVRPFIARKFRLIFRIGMAAIVVGVCVWGIVGPVAAAAATKDDRALTRALSAVNSAINSYTSSNKQLPEDIKTAIDKQGVYGTSDKNEINDLLAKGLISYTPNTSVPPSTMELDDLLKLGRSTTKPFYYELCGTFKYESSGKEYANYQATEPDGYLTYLESGSHKAGKNCYKLKAGYYTYLDAQN